MDRNNVRFLLSLVTAFVLCGAVPFAAAQTSTANTTSPPALPDAIILVEPIDGDDAMVAATYSSAIPHDRAKKQLARLASIAGWKLSAVNVKDQELFDYTQTGEKRSLGKQTGIEAHASNAVIAEGSAFRLQPYVEAYRELQNLDLMFMTGRWNDFTGLRYFDDPALKVELLRDRGPYRYRIEIHTAKGPLPKLPLNQPAPPVQPAAPVQGSIESKPLPLGPVLVIASCAGIAAFVGLRVLSALQKRSRQRRGPGSARPLQSGPYIATRRKD